MVNLLDLLNKEFDDDVASKMASAIGESETLTQRAIAGALPAVLGRLVTIASNQQGAAQLFEMLRESGLDGRRLGSAAQTFASHFATRDLSAIGSPLVAEVFATHQKGITDWLSSFSRIRRSSAESLLGLMVPLVMDFVSRTAASTGRFNASSLAGLLGVQARFLRSAPIGVAGVPWLQSLDASPGFVSASPAGNRGRGWLTWAVPVLALLVILWSVRVSRTEPPAGHLDGTTGPTSAVHSAETVTSTYGVNLGRLTKQVLPNGVELNIPEKGIEIQLAKFIEDPSTPVTPDNWFTFDRIEFETGSARLTASAQDQIRSVAEILKAFPSVAIKVGGYTDSTGDAAANRRLSTERARTTMNALVALGVSQQRLEAEGYGAEHPVASNDTDQGRQRNRRIDLRVTHK